MCSNQADTSLAPRHAEASRRLRRAGMPRPGMRRAFTLVELTVVLLILGIAAAAVTLGLHAPLGRVKMQDATDAMLAFDRLTRAAARQQDRPLAMRLSLREGGPIERCAAGDDAPLTAPLLLPSGCRIAVVLAGDERLTGPSAEIACSSQGYTPTYAMAIEGPGEVQQWLVLAGLTGQVTPVEDESHAKEILEAQRHYAR